MEADRASMLVGSWRDTLAGDPVDAQGGVVRTYDIASDPLASHP